MRVLNLTSNRMARFYVQQVDVLERLGVDQTTLSPPGSEHIQMDSDEARSPLDYARFVPEVLAHLDDDYDLIHANYGLSVPPALLQSKLPVVLSLWGSDLMGEYGWLCKRLAKRCDAVIVMSQDMADQLPCDSYVIPHGVNFDRFRPIPREEALETAGWDPDAKNVLFPYPPNREVKDFPKAERVVEAVDDLLDEPVEIRTLSGVAHEDMPYYYNAADAMLMTSVHEGSPNSVKEALACNTPVVSVDVGDVRERLSGVGNAAVCDAEAELVSQLATVLRSGERSNGREVVRELSLEHMGQRILDVYEQVLDLPRKDADLNRRVSIV
ncbi:glycosyltransferase [Halobium salinum]|uniref:Glycosyltransferase n=1 Tax=Halobium salinum TaxID=1364940 RepID=A0ABD5PA71_9EURY